MKTVLYALSAKADDLAATALSVCAEAKAIAEVCAEAGAAEFDPRDALGPITAMLTFQRLLNERTDALMKSLYAESRTAVTRIAEGVPPEALDSAACLLAEFLKEPPPEIPMTLSRLMVVMHNAISDTSVRVEVLGEFYTLFEEEKRRCQ